MHQKLRFRFLLQFQLSTVLILKVPVIVILPERFAPICSEKLRHEIGLARPVADQVAGVHIQKHMRLSHIDHAPVQQFSVQTVRLDQLRQHIPRVRVDLMDFRMDNPSRHMAHDGYACLIMREYGTEHGVAHKYRLQSCFQAYRFHRLSGKAKAYGVVHAGLGRRIQYGVIKIRLIWCQVLIPLKGRAVPQIQIHLVLFGKMCGNLSGGLPCKDIPVVHAKRFQLRRGQRCGNGIPAKLEEVVIHTDPFHAQYRFKGSANRCLLRCSRLQVGFHLRINVRLRQSKAIHLAVAVKGD